MEWYQHSIVEMLLTILVAVSGNTKTYGRMVATVAVPRSSSKTMAGLGTERVIKTKLWPSSTAEGG